MPTLIEVYSDGSGNTMASDGGFGYCVVVDGTLLAEGSGYIPQATNNIAELTAAIEGLKKALSFVTQNKWLPLPKVTLIADSQLVLQYATGKWRCKAEHLLPLREELQKVFNLLQADTRWVKGHAGNEYNEKCDKLAGAAREGKGL